MVGMPHTAPLHERFRAMALALLVSSAACVADDGPKNDGDRTLATAEIASVSSGILHGWPEATAHLRVDVEGDRVSVDLGSARPTGLDAFWSIASTRPASAFFYADAVRGTDETRVAYADKIADVSQLRDAATLDFTRSSVGPVPIGGVVVLEHQRLGRYLAIVVDAIAPTDPRTAGAGPYAHADVRWYLTAEGSSDFGAAR
jgi:hypothetical protein